MTVEEMRTTLGTLGGQMTFQRGDRGLRLLAVAAGLGLDRGDSPWSVWAMAHGIEILLPSGERIRRRSREIDCGLSHDDPRVLPPRGENT